MTHVVTGNCDGCRFTECVTTCPVACFHADENMLYIDPQECIDCAACVPACPVQAISSEYDLEEADMHWVEINAEKSAVLKVLSEKEEPLAGAEARRQALGF